MQVLPAELSSRLGQGRLQQTRVPHSQTAVVIGDLLQMRFENVVERQENRVHGLLRELLERSLVLCVDLLAGVADADLTGRGIDGRDGHRFPVGSQFQWLLRVDLEQFEDGPVDNEGLAITVADKGFDHGNSHIRAELI